MPQIIIHAEDDGLARAKAELVNKVRKEMIRCLELEPHQGQVFLYEALPIHRAMTPSKKAMLFMEIKMIEGRSDAMKQALVDALANIVEETMGIDRKQVLCLFEEHARSAYISGK